MSLTMTPRAAGRGSMPRTARPGRPRGSWIDRPPLGYREPLCPDNLWGHLVATAVPGTEEWRDGAYRRTVRLPGGPGVLVLPPPTGGVVPPNCT